LQPLRLEDRESRERERQAAPHKARHKASAKPDGELEATADLGKDEETHQLDERA
jgi:6-phosphogluconolactonase (cycloisomerase 2 family)